MPVITAMVSQDPQSGVTVSAAALAGSCALKLLCLDWLTKVPQVALLRQHCPQRQCVAVSLTHSETSGNRPCPHL